MIHNPYMMDELRPFTNRYLFDATPVFSYFKAMMTPKLEDREKNYIVLRTIRMYIHYTVDDVLGKSKDASICYSEFVMELESIFRIKTDEEQERVLKTLDNCLGKFIRHQLGVNISYMSHEVDISVDELGVVSLMVYPSLLSAADKLKITLENVEAEGGWVSERYKREINEQFNQQYN